jgi:hypothetical protein
MKKFAFCAAALAILCLMSACSEKEGVYSPKKKIAKVYQASTYIYGFHEEVSGEWFYDTNSSPKTLAEDWTWDGSKLSKITIYETGNVISKGEVADIINFTYDGKQATRIEGYDQYMTISYDGSKLKQVQIFDKEDNELEGAMEFVHDGKKITKINVTINDEDLVKSPSAMNLQKVLFRGILPTIDQADRVVAAMDKVVKSNGAKAQRTIPVELTWTGDNVTGISMNQMGMTISGTYVFDNKNNPYQNFLFGIIGTMEDGSMIIFNKNNVTKAVMKTQMSFMGQTFTETEEYNYSYTYDGSWPLTRTMKSVDTDHEDEPYSSEAEVVTYFEYK